MAVVQSLSHAWLSVTPGTAASQASRSFTISRSLLKLLSIESVMPSNHLTLCCPLLLLPLIFPSIRAFSNESILCITWPMTGLISLQSQGLSRVYSNTRVQKHKFFGTQPSLWSNSHIHTWLLKKAIDLTIQNIVGKIMSLLSNMLSRFIIAFLSKSKHLLISLLQ